MFTMELDPQRAHLLKLVDERQTNLAEVSRAIGRNHAYLQQYVRRGTPRFLPEDVREALAEHFNVSPDDLRPQRWTRKPRIMPAQARSGSSDAYPSHSSSEAAESIVPFQRGGSLVDLNGTSFAMIAVYDIRASAGAGAINDQGDPLYYQAFMTNWLRDITTASPGDLAVIRVSGDSMHDTLHNGDHVLVDRTVRHVGRDGIYVLRVQGDELLVKRCMRSARTKLLTIKSDNPIYPSEEGVRDEDVEIEGRVIWLGRNLGG
jgi:phage repressor protein C with HTH and peptisase S24 domain